MMHFYTAMVNDLFYIMEEGNYFQGLKIKM